MTIVKRSIVAERTGTWVRRATAGQARQGRGRQQHLAYPASHD